MQKGRLFDFLFLLVGLPIIGFCQTTTPLKQGMLIQANTLIERTEYLLEAPATLTNAVIIISGKNIVVDFNEAKLLGTMDFAAPNKMHGLAIKISPGSENIILKNANISEILSDYTHKSNQDRKILLKRRELTRLQKELIKGLTIVPYRVFLNEKGLIKVEIALAKGKNLYDKRETMKKRDIEREINQNP